MMVIKSNIELQNNINQFPLLDFHHRHLFAEPRDHSPDGTYYMDKGGGRVGSRVDR